MEYRKVIDINRFMSFRRKNFNEEDYGTYVLIVTLVFFFETYYKKKNSLILMMCIKDRKSNAQNKNSQLM